MQDKSRFCRIQSKSAYSHTHPFLHFFAFIKHNTRTFLYTINKKNYSLFTYYLAVTDLLFMCLFMGEGIKIDMIYYNIFLLIERQENQK